MIGFKRYVLVGLFVSLSVLAGLAGRQAIPAHPGVTVAPAGQHIAGDYPPIWPPMASALVR